MIDLYTWTTPNGRKVSIMLEELGVPYNVHAVNIGKNEQFKPEFVAINPNSKIPAIVDPEGPDGEPISLMESGAILIYLGEKCGRLIPENSRRLQQVLKTLGPAPRVHRIQELEHAFGVELLSIDYGIRMTRGEHREIAHVGGQFETLGEPLDCIGIERPCERRKSYLQRVAGCRRGVERVERRLRVRRDFEQSRELGRDFPQRSALLKHLEHARGTRFHEPARKLLPHALGNQRVGFSACDDRAHELERLGRDIEAKARGESRNPQDSHGVFDKCGADVAKNAGAQILRAVVGVYEVSIGIARDRVDREIAPRKIVLQRHVGRAVELESVISAAALAFGAGERMLFVRFRVQENREIPADGPVTELDHFLGCGADHDVIAVFDRQIEQLVPDRASDLVNLHRCSR